MRKFTNTLGALLVMATSSTFADGHKVKVGMITTLSGGGSGLGIDVRDGFMLAVKGNKNISVITKDDQRKPDIAVQLADKMIQSDKVDVLTGIIWSNLAMAVVPATVNQGKFTHCQFPSKKQKWRSNFSLCSKSFEQLFECRLLQSFKCLFYTVID